MRTFPNKNDRNVSFHAAKCWCVGVTGCKVTLPHKEVDDWKVKAFLKKSIYFCVFYSFFYFVCLLSDQLDIAADMLSLLQIRHHSRVSAGGSRFRIMEKSRRS